MHKLLILFILFFAGWALALGFNVSRGDLIAAIRSGLNQLNSKSELRKDSIKEVMAAPIVKSSQVVSIANSIVKTSALASEVATSDMKSEDRNVTQIKGEQKQLQVFTNEESNDQISEVVYETAHEALQAVGLGPEILNEYEEGDFFDEVRYFDGNQFKSAKVKQAKQVFGVVGSRKVLNVVDQAPSKGKSSNTSNTGAAGTGRANPGVRVGPPDLNIEGRRGGYEVVYFKPGKRDNLIDTIEEPEDVNFSVRGPDLLLADARTDDEIRKLRQRVVSFGHGGEMLLKVSGNAHIIDGEGDDFSVFENPIYDNGRAFLEYAKVGVSMEQDPKSFKWFPCNPNIGDFTLCAGRIATADGGDKFDLKVLGMKKAKFVRIRDIGTNFPPSQYREKNVEGFDLDAIMIINRE